MWTRIRRNALPPAMMTHTAELLEAGMTAFRASRRSIVTGLPLVAAAARRGGSRHAAGSRHGDLRRNAVACAEASPLSRSSRTNQTSQFTDVDRIA